MTTVTISLSDELWRKLQEAATQAGVSPEQRASARLEEWLTQPDAEFQEAVKRVLQKNRELYQRLA